ncbi:hypothetical protein Fmac_013875 [Flemingia macrophylla]|uniref:Uncharacterized protein n=1 Tax=Flemingia macrophylla TaxID=520843 RepID=A0ABD1MA84_9FABA
MDKLAEEGVLSKIGKETYAIIKDKKLEYEFAVVKEENDGQIPQVLDRALLFEDRIYMKALYHALQMTHVSVTKLQSFLEGELNQTATRKIIDKMVRDGFVEPKGSKRLGKRVIHSELTEKKFIEIQKALSATEAMPVISRESFAQGKENGRTNGIANQGDEGDTIICSKSSQDKRPRKTSAVCESLNSDINTDPGRSTPKKFLKLRESATWLLEIASLA